MRQVLRLILAMLALGVSTMAAVADKRAIEAIEIIPGWRTADGGYIAGVRIALAPGWKTYWRAPGDAGIPPNFDWRGSENLGQATLHWPRPDIFEQNGLRTIGYAGEVVFPLELRASDPSRPIRLEGRADLGVCREICIPVDYAMAGAVGGAPGSDRDQAAIRAALAARATPGQGAGVGAVRCRAEPIRDGLRLTTAIEIPPQGRNEIAVVEAGRPDIWVSDAETWREDGTLWVVVDLVPPEAAPFAIDRSALLLTVLAPPAAVEIRGCKPG